ncbi:type I polyketide synthase, partial [Streptomyces olivaceoviridis]|uniref:type I polyketide synthase n=1 Tax=Streptomyces olivaceoviridis TaxID=1921 RepID=UPI0036FC159F
VRGSAVNQDGASNGLSAPNGPSQQRVIQAALDNAGLAPSDVDAVEAHGTGTTLGDPIEAQALLATYGQDRAEGLPLWLGSVKSNIGHTQTAAGIIGVIKTVLALGHSSLPRTLHVDQPSAKVDWASGEVRLLTETVEWPETGRPRRAGVSSFGVSGTNAHVILEQAPQEDEEPGSGEVAVPGGVVPVVVSGRSAAALRGQAARLASFVEQAADIDVAALGWSLLTKRSVFEHRGAVLASNRAEVLAGLRALADGQPAPGVVQDTARCSGEVVFVFPGQGSQWLGMGRELLASSPVFRASMQRCEAALTPFVDWSLTEVVTGQNDDTMLERGDVLLPVLWAIMVSLAELWQSFGVRPAAVVGHSQGEVAAAVVAGALSLSDGARVAALRSKLLTELVGNGGLVAVSLSADEVTKRLPQGVSLAAVNGPESVVISGDTEALHEFMADCERSGIRTRWLPQGAASHSPQVEPLRERLLEALASIEPRQPKVRFCSTVVKDATWLDADYWYRNMRQPVQFEPAIRALLESGHQAFIEVSAHPVLATAIQATAEQQAVYAMATGTLRRNEGGLPRFLLSLATVHCAGVEVGWQAAYRATGTGLLELPTYAFQHRRFWPGPARGVSDVRAVGLTPVDHPLLGAGV